MLARGVRAVNRAPGVDSGRTPGEDTAVFRLLPREEKFFDLFEQQATHSGSASRTLEELTLDYADAKAKAQHIKDLEPAGDTLTHEIARLLNTRLNTPTHREDTY